MYFVARIPRVIAYSILSVAIRPGIRSCDLDHQVYSMGQKNRTLLYPNQYHLWSVYWNYGERWWEGLLGVWEGVGEVKVNKLLQAIYRVRTSVIFVRNIFSTQSSVT